VKASGSRRERGAYFTPHAVAEALANWAIKSRSEIVLDPAAGRGHLLAAAAKRLRDLGRKRSPQIWGVELHGRSFQRLVTNFRAWGISDKNALEGDFFSCVADLPKCDVALMNPPYVRHHDIPTATRDTMINALNGTRGIVDGRASAWAYFLALIPELLKAGGRIAAVLPTDLLASDYGAPVLDYLQNVFSTVSLIYCDGDVFPTLSQQTILLLADGHRKEDGRKAAMELRRVRYAVQGGSGFSLKSKKQGKTFRAGETLPRILAPRSALAIEARLMKRNDVKMIGDLAKVELGYVTGDNGFFHLSAADARRFGISDTHLTRALTRERDLLGVRFTATDWKRRMNEGAKDWLLTPMSGQSRAVRNLLKRKAAKEASESYKCDIRTPWWRVPLTEPPRALMVYMGSKARIVSNTARVQISNSFFRLTKLKDVSPNDLAVASLTSVFRLSAGLNSRLLGGGLRKLEPSDAQRILVPTHRIRPRDLGRVDRLLRVGRWEDACVLADKLILERGLGWSRSLIESARAAAAQLHQAF
jgi:hypothetical protein